MKQINTADADSAQSVTMIGVADAQKGVAFFGTFRLLPVILICHLQRDFDGGRSTVGIEHLRQSRRRAFHKCTGQTDRWFAAHSQKCRMSDLLQLGCDGRVNLRHSVTMHVAPQRRNAIEITVPGGIDQIEAFAALDDWSVFVDPCRHRSERMPDVIVVPLTQLVGSDV